jgi:hypothetical protein
VPHNCTRASRCRVAEAPNGVAQPAVWDVASGFGTARLGARWTAGTRARSQRSGIAEDDLGDWSLPSRLEM